jgi:hypothetical protein
MNAKNSLRCFLALVAVIALGPQSRPEGFHDSLRKGDLAAVTRALDENRALSVVPNRMPGPNRPRSPDSQTCCAAPGTTCALRIMPGRQPRRPESVLRFRLFLPSLMNLPDGPAETVRRVRPGHGRGSLRSSDAARARRGHRGPAGIGRGLVILDRRVSQDGRHGERP